MASDFDFLTGLIPLKKKIGKMLKVLAGRKKTLKKNILHT